MARYLITGGTGFIGSRLVAHLVEKGHEALVYTRHPEKYQGTHGEAVRYVDSFDVLGRQAAIDIVVNLAGAGIGDKRWSESRKQLLHESRVGLTRRLVAYLQSLESKPAVMISGSAVGWYGASDDRPLAESDGFNPEYTHEICEDWEQAASAVTALGVRLCIVRLGIVLGKDARGKSGGVLKRLMPPFYFGLGGRIGSGRQFMSWVHLNDVIRALDYLRDNPALDGVFNLTAPGAVSNSDFTSAIGRAIHRPTPFPLPGFVVKLLFGEMGDRLLLQGQNVHPTRLLANGFTFDFPHLDKALAGILVR